MYYNNEICQKFLFLSYFWIDLCCIMIVLLINKNTLDIVCSVVYSFIVYFIINIIIFMKLKKALSILMCSFFAFFGFIYAGNCQFQTDAWSCLNAWCSNPTLCSTNSDCGSLIWSTFWIWVIISTQCDLSSPPTTGSCWTLWWTCAIWTPINDNNQNACGYTRTWYCDGINGWWQSSLCFVNNPACTISSTSINLSVLYPLWLYVNQRNILYNQSGAIPLFCPTTSSGTLQTTFSIASPASFNWWCVWSTVLSTWTIRPNQPTACGISSSIGASSITTWACIAWINHNDTSIVSNIKVLNILGWWQTNIDRQWTCGGDYHNSISCSTPSLWACGSAGSGNNQSFPSLSSTDSRLCANGSITSFLPTTITTSPFYIAQYRWGCLWSSSTTPSSCSAYQAATTTPGICSSLVNGQYLSYNQIQYANLCTVWAGVPTLSPVPVNGKWNWTCVWYGWAASASCSANAIINGVCNTFTSPQSSIPSNLCTSWIPTTVMSTTWTYQRTCNSTSGGLPSSLCSASCSASSCSMTSSSTWSSITWSTSIITWSTITWANGQTTPISFNLVCTDPDGCVCYNVTIVNGSRCLANNFTGVSDSIITPIDVGIVCTDTDGCLCNKLNTIVNGAICQTDGLTWYLPWISDLSVYQTITSGSILRKWQLDITINYINRGPNIATGAKLEYYLSPLVSKIRTNAPYTFSQISSSGYIESSEYQNKVLVFPLWDVPVWENGSVIISITLNANLTDKEVINSTSIASRVKDSKPLDNTQKMVMSFTTQTATNLWNYIVNPLLTLQQIMKQYTTMNDWLNINPIFLDVQKWKDNYMSVMTVVRNGIFEWYQYTHSRKFEWEKCSTRSEVITVLARMMYTAGSSDVYVSRPSGTAYIDTNDFWSQTKNFINWAHERWLILFLNPKNIKWSFYLEPNKVITEWELKDMINSLYTRYGLNTTILDDLLNDESNCVTRFDFADVIATILRWNPNIMMWYNDEFISTIIKKTYLMSIIDRRAAIQKIIDKLKSTTPTLLYENGYDIESLLWILETAMDGREYNPIITASQNSISLAESL